MFPTFVTSFKDQLFAVLINLFGTVVGALMTSLFNSLTRGLVDPLLAALVNAVT